MQRIRLVADPRLEGVGLVPWELEQGILRLLGDLVNTFNVESTVLVLNAYRGGGHAGGTSNGGRCDGRGEREAGKRCERSMHASKRSVSGADREWGKRRRW